MTERFAGARTALVERVAEVPHRITRGLKGLTAELGDVPRGRCTDEFLECGLATGAKVDHTAPRHVPGSAALEVNVRVILVGRVRAEELDHLELGRRGARGILARLLVRRETARVGMGPGVRG